MSISVPNLKLIHNQFKNLDFRCSIIDFSRNGSVQIPLFPLNWCVAKAAHILQKGKPVVFFFLKRQTNFCSHSLNTHKRHKILVCTTVYLLETSKYSIKVTCALLLSPALSFSLMCRCTFCMYSSICLN